MNKNKIISILEDWNPWKKELETGILRSSYLEQLKNFSRTEHVIAIIGSRRSGKSYLMKQFAHYLIHDEKIPKNRILIVNFEDPRLTELNVGVLEEIYKTYLEFLAPQDKPTIFLDEVQEVPGWEKWVRTMQELGKARIIISGSNAKLLSQELSTLLTGRHLDVTVYPLSFNEYLSFKEIKLQDPLDFIHREVELQGHLRKYLEMGSFPAVVFFPNKEILLSYFEDILNKDLIRRYKIRKNEKLKSLANYYLSQSASLTTYNSAAKFLGLSPNSVEKFSGYLEASYLFFFLKRFSFKVKEQEKSPRKLYVIDTGLANAVGFRFSENWGRLMENVVFLELMRRRIRQTNIEFFYWKDVQHHEVDFVVKEGFNVTQLIQVVADTSSPKVREREKRSLLKAMKEFGLTESYVITSNETSEEVIDGKKIKFIPLWQWLLA